MRRSIELAAILTVLAVPLAAQAQEPRLPQRTMPEAAPPVISTHQIDRYDAINKLQQTLKDNPRSLADWVILGELAHEVALDQPADQADRYYKMSRDAYEKALELEPNNPGLKAAVQFAKDQEANSAQFEAARDRAVTSYLDARRRDLAATSYTPSLRVYGPLAAASAPATATATTTAPATAAVPGSTTATTTVPAGTAPPINPSSPGNAGVTTAATADPGVASANLGTRQYYSYPIYQPYYMPRTPYTFQQYSSGYFPPNLTTNPAVQPMTLQRYLNPQRLLSTPVR